MVNIQPPAHLPPFLKKCKHGVGGECPVWNPSFSLPKMCEQGASCKCLAWTPNISCLRTSALSLVGGTGTLWCTWPCQETYSRLLCTQKSVSILSLGRRGSVPTLLDVWHEAHQPSNLHAIIQGPVDAKM